MYGVCRGCDKGCVTRIVCFVCELKSTTYVGWEQDSHLELLHMEEQAIPLVGRGPIRAGGLGAGKHYGQEVLERSQPGEPKSSQQADATAVDQPGGDGCWTTPVAWTTLWIPHCTLTCTLLCNKPRHAGSCMQAVAWSGTVAAHPTEQLLLLSICPFACLSSSRTAAAYNKRRQQHAKYTAGSVMQGVDGW